MGNRSPGAPRWSRRRLLGVALGASLAGCSSLWAKAAPAEVSAATLPERPGVLEVDVDGDLRKSWARVLDGDGRTELARCESIPCRAVLPPGRYRVVVGSGRVFGWGDVDRAEVDVDVAACATERIRVSLRARLGPDRGRVVRHDRVPLASDPRRTGNIPRPCASSEEASTPGGAAGPDGRPSGTSLVPRP